MRRVLHEGHTSVLDDAGSVTTKANPWTSVVNDRKLAGLGLGLRYSRTTWSLDAVVAWRDQGGKPTSNTSAADPLAWLGQRGWVDTRLDRLTGSPCQSPSLLITLV